MHPATAGGSGGQNPSRSGCPATVERITYLIYLRIHDTKVIADPIERQYAADVQTEALLRHQIHLWDIPYWMHLFGIRIEQYERSSQKVVTTLERFRAAICTMPRAQIKSTWADVDTRNAEVHRHRFFLQRCEGHVAANIRFVRQRLKSRST